MKKLILTLFYVLLLIALCSCNNADITSPKTLGMRKVFVSPYPNSAIIDIHGTENIYFCNGMRYDGTAGTNQTIFIEYKSSETGIDGIDNADCESINGNLTNTVIIKFYNGDSQSINCRGMKYSTDEDGIFIHVNLRSTEMRWPIESIRTADCEIQ